MARKKKPKPTTKWGKIWYFIWEDDSVWSWIVNVGLAFLLIKFLVYPGLGLMLATDFPVVAVVSGSMEHNGLSFDKWWAANYGFYNEYDITEQDFRDFQYTNGFNTGDIMVLYGTKPEKIEVGDTIVFKSMRPDPIIHRVIKLWTNEKDGTVEYHYQTKGDNNRNSIKDASLNEMDIHQDQLVGRAVIRVPYLGWIKIGFFKLIQLII